MKGKRYIEEIWSWHYFKKILEACPNREASFLLAAYFGTGARLNELLLIKKKEIKEIEHNSMRFLTFIVPTFKNPTVHARNTYVSFQLESENFLIPIIQDWIKDLDEEDKIYCHSGRWVEKLCRKWFGKHPHFFRHCRATYNINVLRMRDVENQKFMGWSDTQPAATYTHLSQENMLDIYHRFEKNET